MLIGYRLDLFLLAFVFEVSPARDIVFWEYAEFADKRAGFTECIRFSKSYFAETPNGVVSYTIGT